MAGTLAYGFLLGSALANDLTGSLAQARMSHAASPLSDGRVLVTGGDTAINSLTSMTNSSEIYDPVAGRFTSTGSMIYSRVGHAMVPLADGRLLALGGLGTSQPLNTAEIYNPATGQWSLTGAMTTARRSPLAIALQNGKVLVIGGDESITSTEIFDPVTGQFSASGSIVSNGRRDASAVLLADGRVLLVGGYNAQFTNLASAEVWNPANGTWSQTGTMQFARTRMTTTLLANGKVLVAGGSNGNTFAPSAELYDPSIGNFVFGGTHIVPRIWHAVSLLSDGSVVILGGNNSSAAVENSMERFDPSSGVWSSVGQMAQGRRSTSASLLGNGKVLLAGGYAYPGPLASAELFDVNCATAVLSLSPTSQSFPIGGGTGSLQISQRAGCGWQITQVPSWISISSSSGSGNATVSFTVAANTGQGRGATLSINGKTFSVTQASAVPACDAKVSSSIYPSSASFAATGGSGSISVTTGTGCQWGVSGLPSWVTLTSASSGYGNATVGYSVATNTGLARSASFYVAVGGANLAFSMSQQAATQVADCTPVAMTIGATVTGALASSDCTSGARGSSYYTDRYSFTGTPGQRISIQLSSSAFDTYLYLKNPSGTVIASNDDGGGGTNSRVPATTGYFTIPAGATGTYVIEVSSYGQRATGSYSLSSAAY